MNPRPCLTEQPSATGERRRRQARRLEILQLQKYRTSKPRTAYFGRFSRFGRMAHSE
jgi:hypothetical protein